MALQKGEASALMTKLVSESSSYTTTLAGLFVLDLIIYKKGHDIIGAGFALIFICCAIGLFFYWIGHIVESCISLKNKHSDSRLASVHAFIILICLVFSYIVALVIAIITLLDTFILN